MSTQWKIGTRDSQLALWQANHVKTLLSTIGVNSILIPVKSEGDINLSTPLYEMGVQGIFTKTLDVALLNSSIDIAVHSYKDVPTMLPQGLIKVAVLPRASSADVLVFNSKKNNGELDTICKQGESNKGDLIYTIATSSTRRKAQWLNRFPNHQLEPIRGNVNRRLEKLNNSNWNAAIFAKAGLERINLLPENAITIDWMLPAPAQGAIVVITREDNNALINLIKDLNDFETDLCTNIERDFLRTLMGGCTTPISALAYIENEYVHFSGQLLSLDGKEKLTIEKKAHQKDAESIGKIAGNEILENGGIAIINKIKAGDKAN